MAGGASRPSLSDSSVAESAFASGCFDSDIFLIDGESRIGEANRIQDDLPIFCQKFAPQSVPFVTEGDAYHVS